MTRALHHNEHRAPASEWRPSLQRFVITSTRCLFVLCVSFLIYRVLRIVFLPLPGIAQYVPDDTFYYLELSRNLALVHLPTFDGGHTLTTGFHPLWAWIAEALAVLTNFDRMHLLRAMVLVSGGIAVVPVIFAGKLAWKSPFTALPAITLLISSYAFINNTYAGMEWSCVVAFSSAAFYLLLSTRNFSSRARYTGLFLFAAAGSLARSDFSGQPACWLCAAFVVWRIEKDKRLILPSFIALLGGVAGLLIDIWYDHHLTGHFLQGSARMKAMWGHARPWNLVPFFRVVMRTVLVLPDHRIGMRVTQSASEQAIGAHAAVPPHSYALMLVICILFVVIVWALPFLLRRIMIDLSTMDFFLCLSASFTLAIYAVVYAQNSMATQIWYSAEITLAIGSLLYLLLRLAERGGVVPSAALLFAALACINLVIYMRSEPVYALQSASPADAYAVHAALGDAPIGISDAGIFAFSYGGGVINLDGLMNDEIVDYAPHRLPCYLADKGILFFNGFGRSSEYAFHPPSPDTYATRVSIPVPNQPALILYRADFARIRALPQCISQ